MKFAFALAVTFFGLSTLVAGQSYTMTKCTSTGVRRNFNNLSDAERMTVINAIQVLKNTPDPSTPARSIYDRYVRIHYDYRAKYHGTPAFLPWHRVFLRQFELELQKVDASIMVPYWDFTLSSQAPEKSIVFSSRYFGSDGDASTGCVTNGQFKNWNISYPNSCCLKRQFNAGPNLIGALVAPEVVQSFFTTSEVSNFTDWSNAFQTFHGQAHVGVGGAMATMASANDPIFYLLHSKVDEMWTSYQNFGGSDAISNYSGDWNQVLEPFGITARQAMIYTQFCYTYETYILPKATNSFAKRSLSDTDGLLESKRNNRAYGRFFARDYSRSPASTKSTTAVQPYYSTTPSDTYYQSTTSNKPTSTASIYYPFTVKTTSTAAYTTTAPTSTSINGVGDQNTTITNFTVNCCLVNVPGYCNGFLTVSIPSTASTDANNVGCNVTARSAIPVSVTESTDGSTGSTAVNSTDVSTTSTGGKGNNSNGYSIATTANITSTSASPYNNNNDTIISLETDAITPPSESVYTTPKVSSYGSSKKPSTSANPYAVSPADRTNLHSIRLPVQLPDSWFTMNGMSISYGRTFESQIGSVILTLNKDNVTSVSCLKYRVNTTTDSGSYDSVPVQAYIDQGVQVPQNTSADIPPITVSINLGGQSSTESVATVQSSASISTPSIMAISALVVSIVGQLAW